MKPAKILYFVNGPAPSPEDFKAANALAATVVFRNATAVPAEAHSLELCDGVAGAVPSIYANAYPDADEAIATKKEELEKLTSLVGDEAPPKPAVNSNTQVPSSTGDAGDSGTGAASTEPPAAPATPAAPGAKPKAPVWNPNGAAK